MLRYQRKARTPLRILVAEFARIREHRDVSPTSGDLGYDLRPRYARCQNGVFRNGFTLIELFISIAVMGIIAGMVMSYMQPTMQDHLTSTAQLIASDLAYAQSLAVSNNSTYRMVFDKPENQYVLRHSGSNSLLDALPPNPFRSPGDPPDQHITDLDELPQLTAAARILSVRALSTPASEVADVEFGPLGETTRSEATLIWLSIGAGSGARYQSLQVDAVTGLTTLGDLTATPPPGLLSTVPPLSQP